MAFASMLIQTHFFCPGPVTTCRCYANIDTGARDELPAEGMAEDHNNFEWTHIH